MAKVFLDTNYFIDSIHRRPAKNILASLEHHTIYISPLSLHIYFYIYKIKIPDLRVTAQRDKFQIVKFSEVILDSSLMGPTSDFEDNVQLHSAAQEECDVFLTNDRDLLSMRFFGKTRIINELLDNQPS